MPLKVAWEEGPNLDRPGVQVPIRSILFRPWMGLNRIDPYRRHRKACPPFTVPRNVRGTQSAKIVFYRLACRDSLIYTAKTSLKIFGCTPRGKMGEPLDASQCNGTEKG